MGFTFILPVIHPESNQVGNYSHVELILKRTLETLKKQSLGDVKIIVVCCKIPSWTQEIGSNVFFLDVSKSDIFKPNPNSAKDSNLRRYDKGLKYILGILYAQSKFKTDLFMRVDADDYVNTRLVEYSLESIKKLSESTLFDGYVLNKGLEVEISVTQNNEIKYGKTYLIKDFDRSCGTCHIFKKTTLVKKLLEIHSDILEKSNWCFSSAKNQNFIVPKEFLDWLGNITKNDFTEECHPVNILGRHVKLEKYFTFVPIPFMGAAKACGHGNHVGHIRGGIHFDRVVSQLPTRIFKSAFGVHKTFRAIITPMLLYMNVMFYFYSKSEKIKGYVSGKVRIKIG